ncbi:MAG: phosphotransferase family protein [Tepidiformaceae bacterium]
MSRPEPEQTEAPDEAASAPIEPVGAISDTPLALSQPIDDALLGYLCERLDRPELAFATTPQRLTGGFDTTIYRFQLTGAPAGFDGGLVIRIFTRDGGRVAREAAIQETVAQSGFPAPRILALCLDAGPLGAPFTIMPLVQGKTVLDAIASPSLFLFRAPALMAEMHARLHALEPGILYRALASAGLPPGPEGTRGFLAMLRSELTAVPDAGMTPGLEWLEGRLPAASVAPAICHLDFHPLNILVDHGRVTGVIDWVNAALSDPAFDVGSTIMLMTLGPVDLPGPLEGVVAAGRRWAARRYLRAYQQIRPLPIERIEYGEALRCYTGLQHASQRLAPGAPEPAAALPYAWGTPKEVLGLSRRFHELTGITLASERLQGLWRTD